MEYEIRHQLPGRLRLRLAALSCGEYRHRIETALLADERVRGIHISALARSITITYRPDSLTLEDVLCFLDPDKTPEETCREEAPSVEPRIEPEEAARPDSVEPREQGTEEALPEVVEEAPKPATKKASPRPTVKKAAVKGTTRGKAKPAKKETKPKAAAKSAKGKPEH